MVWMNERRASSVAEERCSWQGDRLQTQPSLRADTGGRREREVAVEGSHPRSRAGILNHRGSYNKAKCADLQRSGFNYMHS